MYILPVKDPALRKSLRMTFSHAAGCPLGDIPDSALLWDEGGTKTLKKLRIRDLHLLVFCLEGRSDYVDDKKTRHVLTAGDLLLVPRGLPHSYRPTPGHGWSEIYVWLRGPLFDLWWSQGWLKAGVNVLSLSPVADWANRLSLIMGSQHLSDESERITSLQGWVAEALAVRRNQGGPPPWFTQARRALENGTLREPALPALAARLGLSYKAFREGFTQYAGQPPGQFRAGAVARNLARELRGSHETLKTLAEHYGFSDEFHLSKSFRRHIGVTPYQYRSL